jgi:hypothetical protein
MAERVLVNPLSGAEIIEAVADKVRKSLQKDCFLSPNLSYDYYSAEVKISLTAHDVGRDAKVEQAIHDTQGEIAENEDAALDAADAEFAIDAEPPNTVRVESGQPVPVLTRGEDGKPAIRKVKYGRKQAEKVAANAS